MLKIFKKIFKKKKTVMGQKCKGENNIQIQICEVNKEENYKLKDTN